MSCKPAIASMSLGRAWVHNFDEKVKQAAEAGFEGIEIFYEDLEYLAKTYSENASDEPDESALLSAASHIRSICDKLGLTIIALQPFLFYEGLIDRQEHEARIEKLKIWFKIVKLLGTDIIQIPSNFQQTGTSGDMDLIVADMKLVADLGLKEEPPVRFAYENLAWGTHVNTWEVLWEIVQRVDRPNFGCCLDTFNIAGRVWADPESPTGKVDNADSILQVTLNKLVETIDLSKVFYVQVVDGEKMKSPLIKGHPFYVEGQPARMSWSRNARLFLYEEDRGGYLPVVEVAKAFLIEMGYEGWVSMELFSRSMADPDPDVPKSHSQRAMNSWRTLEKDLSLN